VVCVTVNIRFRIVGEVVLNAITVSRLYIFGLCIAVFIAECFSNICGFY